MLASLRALRAEIISQFARSQHRYYEGKLPSKLLSAFACYEILFGLRLEILTVAGLR